MFSSESTEGVFKECKYTRGIVSIFSHRWRTFLVLAITAAWRTGVAIYFNY